MKTCKIFLIMISLAGFFLLPACKGGKDKPAETQEEILPDNIVEMNAQQMKMGNIEFGQIAAKTLAGKIKVNGQVTVDPQHYASVCAPLGGFVKSAGLLPGSFVKKGQVLATLENQEFIDIQQSYLESKSRLEFAEAELKRHSDLNQYEVYSKKNDQEVTAEYNSLKAQVKAIGQKLILIGIDPSGLRVDDISRSITVLSPIDGYLKAVNVNIGKYIEPKDVMFEIVGIDKLLLELDLFEKDANKVQAGQDISFIINNEEEEHHAKIYQVGKSVDSDRTFKIYAAVEGICKSVIPGMYVNAGIEVTSQTVTALPAEAIVSFDDKQFIFVYEKEKTEKGKPVTEFRIVEVMTGITDGNFTEIILPAGLDLTHARVVIKGAYNLLAAKKNAGEMSC